MNITLDPPLEAAAERFTADLNAKRPKDANGDFIDPPQTVEQVVTANLNAVVQSWSDAYASADKTALGEDAELLALGVAVKNNPDKRPAAIAAVQQVLAN